VEQTCAGCGCLVEEGVRLIPCDTPECCCLELPIAEPMEVLAARIRVSFNAHDIENFRTLIADDAQWGFDPNDPRTCRSRNDIIVNDKRLLGSGVRGRVVDTDTGPRGVACLLEVEWPDPETARSASFYQVFVVADGLVTRIEGHDEREGTLEAINA
jgi:hypothetical protein